MKLRLGLLAVMALFSFNATASNSVTFLVQATSCTGFCQDLLPTPYTMTVDLGAPEYYVDFPIVESDMFFEENVLIFNHGGSAMTPTGLADLVQATAFKWTFGPEVGLPGSGQGTPTGSNSTRASMGFDTGTGSIVLEQLASIPLSLQRTYTLGDFATLLSAPSPWSYSARSGPYGTPQESVYSGSATVQSFALQLAPVPEPAAAGLFGLGSLVVLSVAALRRRGQRNRTAP